MNLRATKHFRYSTRRLLPGDIFEASARDARLLIAVRKAEAVREPADVPPPPPAVAAKIADAMQAASPSDELRLLRAEYRRVFDKPPFHGWNVATLKEKIAAAST